MKLSELQKYMQSLQTLPDPTDPQQQSDLLRRLGLEMSDIYQELEMESAFVDTHRDVSNSYSYFKLHSHRFYELLYCRSGSVEYLIGTQRYRLQKDDIVLVSPGVSHCPILPEHLQEPYVRDVVWISPEFMQRLSRDFPTLFAQQSAGLPLLRTGNTKWERLGDLFNAGISISQSDTPEREMALVGNTVTLLSQLFQATLHLKNRQTRAEKPELLERVIAYVSQNMHEKLVLEEVAQHFFVSQSTICQVFRSKTGTSFHRFVTQMRLITAKERIAEGVPLETVSAQVGFSDYSTFYRAFKQEFGISPRQFRALLETQTAII